MRGVAALGAAAILLAGCLGQPTPARQCASVAACLFDVGEPLTVVVHASEGLQLRPGTKAALEAQVQDIAGGTVRWHDGPTLPELPPELDEDGLRGLHLSDDQTVLRVYLVDTTHLVGDEPVAGLSFPGTPPVFLFPRTMDLRVEQADLDGPRREAARDRVEEIVLVHELGHVLGLVGCGISMSRPHDDPSAACHSANATSIMHARVARVQQWPAWDAAVPLSPFGWDADDRADLALRRAVLAT